MAMHMLLGSKTGGSVIRVMAGNNQHSTHQIRFFRNVSAPDFVRTYRVTTANH